jgi:metallo-beta-lactamase class B
VRRGVGGTASRLTAVLPRIDHTAVRVRHEMSCANNAACRVIVCANGPLPGGFPLWKLRCRGLLLCGLLLWSAGSAQEGAAPVESPAVAARVARAFEIAGPDARDFGLHVLCEPTSELFGHMLGLRDGPEGSVVHTGRAFDNIHHIGFNWVGTWLITTSEGLILIDALNDAGEAETILVPAIRELGFDPADLVYVVVTHGHFDHFGGARYLQDTFGARVVLSEADWQLIEQRPAAAAASLPGPRRDVIVGDGETLTLGDTTITILHTPGHTAGTISLVIPAVWQGETHYLTLAGGSAMPATPAAIATYLDSMHKLWEAGRRAGAVGVLSTHAYMHGAIEKLAQMRERTPRDPNPFLLGADGYERFMSSQSECVVANLIRMQQ